jgi:hypothetical protein
MQTAQNKILSKPEKTGRRNPHYTLIWYAFHKQHIPYYQNGYSQEVLLQCSEWRTGEHENRYVFR